MNRKRVLILGAGISGLSTAWFLKKRFGSQVDLKIIEKAEKAGGWVQTLRGKRFNLELGPRGFRPRGKGRATLELCYKLGLKGELIASDVTAKKRYVFYKKKLIAIPYNINSLFQFPFKYQLIKYLIKDYLYPIKSEGDVSVRSFFEQRLGCVVLENLVDPFFSGIYGGGVEQASCQACFPELFNGVKKSGSLLKFFKSKKQDEKGDFSSASLLSFRNGMQCLPEALERDLEDKVIKGEEIISIKKQNRGFSLKSNIKEHTADIVISTLPYKKLEQLLPRISHKVGLHYNSIRLLNLVVKMSDFPKKYKGFGYLIPSIEKLNLLGCVFDSFVFPEQEKDNAFLRFSLMFGGYERYDYIKSLSDQELTLIGVDILNKHLKAKLTVVESKVFDAKEAIGVPLVGFNEEKEAFFKELNLSMPNFYALGSSFNGAAINDCIYHAQCFAESLSLDNEARLKRSFCCS